MKTTEELKNLLYKNETVADAAPDAIAAAQEFCEGYKTFLDNAKTCLLYTSTLYTVCRNSRGGSTLFSATISTVHTVPSASPHSPNRYLLPTSCAGVTGSVRA